MKNIWRGIIVAFSMYSSIKMPQIEWDDNNLKYAMCCFPLVGVAIGGLLALLYFLAVGMGASMILLATLAAVLPVVVSGGIHFDGFVDTSDALASNQPVERKLEILKDSHVGAFAVIQSIVYFFVWFGFWYQAFVSLDGQVRILICLCLVPVLSRAAVGTALVTIDTARSSGLAHLFARSSDKIVVRNVNVCIQLVCFAVAISLSPLIGFGFVMAAVIYYFVFRAVVVVQFGGFTGDLAGYFLLNYELLLLILVVCLLLL